MAHSLEDLIGNQIAGLLLKPSHMKEAHTPEDLLTTEQVAALLLKPVGTLRQWRHRSFGPVGFRVGGSVRYRRSEVEQWLAAQEAAERDRTPA